MRLTHGIKPTAGTDPLRDPLRQLGKSIETRGKKGKPPPQCRLGLGLEEPLLRSGPPPTRVLDPVKAGLQTPDRTGSHNG